MWLKENLGIASASQAPTSAMQERNSSQFLPLRRSIVVDEAHHLVGDPRFVGARGAWCCKSSLLFLGDASQAAAMPRPDDIARSLVDLPKNQRLSWRRSPKW